MPLCEALRTIKMCREIAWMKNFPLSLKYSSLHNRDNYTLLLKYFRRSTVLNFRLRTVVEFLAFVDNELLDAQSL